MNTVRENLPEDPYLVWSHEHSAWWRADSRGYARDVRGAGIYTRSEAVDISHNSRDHWRPGERPDELPIRLADMPDWVRAALSQEPTS